MVDISLQLVALNAQTVIRHEFLNCSKYFYFIKE